MKYCTKCGNELFDEAVICPKCGCAVSNSMTFGQKQENGSASKIVAKIFLVLSTIFFGIYIIPLAWCLPMTISYFNKVKYREKVSTGFKVCTLLFVSLISGIAMLCDND